MPSTTNHRETIWKVASALGIVCLILLMLSRFLYENPSAVDSTNTAQTSIAAPEPEKVSVSAIEQASKILTEETPVIEPIAFVREPPLEETSDESEPAPVNDNPFALFESSREPETETTELEVSVDIKPTTKAIIRQATRSDEFNELFLVSVRTKTLDPQSLLAFVPPDDWNRFNLRPVKQPIQPAVYSTKTIAAKTRIQSAPIALKQPASITLKIDAPSQLETGRNTSLKFYVTNTGPIELSQISLNVELPSQFAHRHGQSLLHRIEHLKPGEEHQATLTIHVVEKGSVQIQAEVTADDDTRDRASASVTITRSPKQSAAVPSVLAPCPRVEHLRSPVFVSP